MAKTRRTTMITLSHGDLSEAVVEWARSHGLVRGDDDVRVRIDVGTRTEGYGMAERDTPYGEVVLTVESE